MPHIPMQPCMGLSPCRVLRSGTPSVMPLAASCCQQSGACELMSPSHTYPRRHRHACMPAPMQVSLLPTWPPGLLPCCSEAVAAAGLQRNALGEAVRVTVAWEGAVHKTTLVGPAKSRHTTWRYMDSGLMVVRTAVQLDRSRETHMFWYLEAIDEPEHQPAALHGACLAARLWAAEHCACMGVHCRNCSRPVSLPARL